MDEVLILENVTPICAGKLRQSMLRSALEEGCENVDERRVK